MRNNDVIIKKLLASGRLRADLKTGRVFSSKSNTPDKPIGTATVKGYLRACVNFEGKQVHVMLHRVVWIAAHGIPPEGHQIDHGPMGKSFNALSNLESVTGGENIRRAVEGGLLKPVCGSDHYAAKLTPEDVKSLRERSSQGESGAALGRAFGISESHARRIARGERWSRAGRLLDGREWGEMPGVRA
ncbi:HNH endonuclease [Pararhodobacter sp.]|uniref:HNH endonuclease n=1 Tax=Pararhodobacter sp. TaxID=2127056 RepID=UPI002FDD74E9